MECISHDQLSSYTLPENYILQSQVDNICLIDGKKFTSRFYILVWNEQAYLFNGGFVVIHGVPYDANSTDYDVQINHEGYNKTDGLASIQPIDHFEEIQEFWPEVEKTVKELTPALEELLSASSKSEYIMLGVDYLFQKDQDENKSIKIIEVNAIPNFIHTRKVDQQVNIPFITSSIKTMLGESCDNLIKIK